MISNKFASRNSSLLTYFKNKLKIIINLYIRIILCTASRHIKIKNKRLFFFNFSSFKYSNPTWKYAQQKMSSISIETKRQWIEEKIESIFLDQNKSDLLSRDFELNMLVSAATRYKHESVLKPFPSTFLSDSDNSINYDQLIKALMSMPSVIEWRTRIKKFNKDQLALVYWLLVHRNFQLESISSPSQVCK